MSVVQSGTKMICKQFQVRVNSNGTEVFCNIGRHGYLFASTGPAKTSSTFCNFHVSGDYAMKTARGAGIDTGGSETSVCMFPGEVTALGEPRPDLVRRPQPVSPVLAGGTSLLNLVAVGAGVGLVFGLIGKVLGG